MAHPSLASVWDQGGAVFGGWVSAGLEFSLDMYRQAGFDYVGIDCQHTVYSEPQVAAVVQKASPDGAAIIVRVSKNDSALIGKLCDAGADGIIVPLVNTAEEAAAAVAATRYPPRGVRSFGPNRADLRGNSLEENGDRVSVFAMIETADGLKNVDAITATEGLAGIYVGPADLSIGLGLSPMKAFTTDQLAEPVERIRRACEANGVILGMHQANAATAVTWVKRGVRLATIGSDVGVFQAGARAAITEAKQGTGRG